MIISNLRELASTLSNADGKRFGYRERVRVERLVFLSLKAACKEIGFDLGGMSTVHHQRLRDYIEANGDRDITAIVDRGFNIHRLVVDLASTDPYVRHEAMERVSVDDYRAIQFVARQLTKYCDELMEFDTCL